MCKHNSLQTDTIVEKYLIGQQNKHSIFNFQDTIEYKYRFRWLYIRTMDGTRKTLRVDDSKTLAELMLPICTKMGMPI